MKIILTLLIAIMTLSGSAAREIVSPWRCSSANIYQNNYVDIDYEVSLINTDVIWQQKLSDESSNVLSNLVSDGERLYVIYLNNVQCLDMKTGESIWVRTIGCMYECSSYKDMTELTIFNGALYCIMNCNTELYSLSPIDGTTNWVCNSEKEGIGRFITASVVSDGRLITQNVGSIVCLSEKSGRIRWTQDHGSEPYIMPIIYKNHIIVSNYKGCGILSISTGHLEKQIPEGLSFPFRQIRLADNKIAISYICGLKIYDADTFKQVGTLPFSKDCGPYDFLPIGNRFAYDGKQAVVDAYDLLCIDNTGYLKWEYKDEYFLSPHTGPIIINNHVYLLTYKYKEEKYTFHIIKLDLGTGEEVSDKKYPVMSQSIDKSSVINYGMFASGKFYIIYDNTIYCIGVPE